MKLKFSVAYLLSFLSLVFVIHELHDWAHVLMGQWVCGCWGTKAFDSWTMCDHSDVSGNIIAFIWMAGPLVSYILMWVAYSILNSRKSTASRSMGFSLLFATLPFGRILAVVGGKSDETNMMREFFQRPDGSNHQFVVVSAIVLVLLLTLPPIIKAFSLTSSIKEKMMLIPVLLIFPVVVDYVVVNLGMNKILSDDIMQEESLPGTPFLVLLWGIFWIIFFMLTYNNLIKLFKKSEHRRRKSKSASSVSQEEYMP